MGFSVKYYIIEENDNLKKMPTTKFHKLIDGEEGVSLMQYANKTIKYIEVVVEYENREPVEIYRLEPQYLTLDDKGMADQEELWKEGLSAVNLLTPDIPPQFQESANHDKKIITSKKEVFESKKHRNEYSWVVSDQLKSKIYDDIFKEKKRFKLIK